MRYREVERILNQNGWYAQRQKGSHVQFYCKANGKRCTVVNHAGKDLSLKVVEDIEKKTGLKLR